VAVTAVLFRYYGRVSTLAGATGTQSRHAAIADLLDGLEEIVVFYRSIPAGDQVQRWSDDAELVTGDLARQLSKARKKLFATIPTQR
jgi:hypothetical protein